MPRSARRFWLSLHGLMGFVFMAALVYLLAISLPPETSELRWAAVPLVGVLLALQAVALLFTFRSRVNGDDEAAGSPRTLLPALAAVVAVALLTTTFSALIQPLSVSARLQGIFDQLPDNTVRVARGYAEPSLVFYANGPWDLQASPPDIDALLRSGDPLLFVYRAGERGLDRLMRPGAEPAFPDVSLPELARAAGVPRALVESTLVRTRLRGFNFARTTWTELIVFYRR